VERVEDDLERVHIGHVRIAPRIGDDDPRGIAIEAHHTDVEVFTVMEDSHFGGFGGRFALEGIRLNEVSKRRRTLPCLVAEHAVDGRGRGDTSRERDGTGPGFDGGGLGRHGGGSAVEDGRDSRGNQWLSEEHSTCC
jgi:hypothetical protein